MNSRTIGYQEKNEKQSTAPIRNPQAAPLRADPRFLGLAKKRGIFAYWKTTHTRPDFCATERVPVCQALANAD